MSKYLNPMTDYGFKKLFGEEASKHFLIDFLNSVFEDFIPQIADLSYGKNEHLGAKLIDRNVIFDLYCKDLAGNHFIIELQKAHQTYFKQRTLYYATFAIQEQAQKGKEWDFKLNPVYCLSILNFNFEDNQEANKYLTKVRLQDIETGKVVIDALNFAFLECKKFKKQITVDSSKQDKWIYALSHLAEIQDQPTELQEKLFKDFFEYANIQTLDLDAKAAYNASVSYYQDIHNIEAQNLEKGKLEGKKLGLEEGKKLGLEEGKKLGLEKGKLEGKLEIARKMKQRNTPIEYIIADTGLTKAQIEAL